MGRVRIWRWLSAAMLASGIVGCSQTGATVNPRDFSAPSTSAQPSAEPTAARSFATGAASLVPTAIATASPAPTATAAPAIVLRRAPDNLGCDSIGLSYSSATIRIDPSAADQVWAEVDTLVPDPDQGVSVGDRLLVYWSPSFRGGDAFDPTVRDSSGAVVARDGTRTGELAPPYFLCASTDSIYVLDYHPG